MIYFIRNGTAVKIGFTENKISLDARLKAIQSCNPYTITLEATMKGSKLKERRMHGFCLKKHLHGEWFIMTKGEVNHSPMHLNFFMTKEMKHPNRKRVLRKIANVLNWHYFGEYLDSEMSPDKLAFRCRLIMRYMREDANGRYF